jgi:hypothetical protein
MALWQRLPHPTHPNLSIALTPVLYAGRLPGFGGAHGLALHGFVDFVAHDRRSVEKIGRQFNYTTTVMTVGGTIRP